MRLTPMAAATAACALLAMPLAAQTLKPGLWETTSKMGGNPELEKAMAEMNKQLASMSPAERKQMEAMMGKQGLQMGAGAGGATVMKMCMTREMVERSDFGHAKGDCKTTRQDKSGSTLKMAWACSTPPSSGEGEYTFLGTDAYRSKMKMTHTGAGGKAETMTVEGSGRWLGSDCGAIAPMAPPKK